MKRRKGRLRSYNYKTEKKKKKKKKRKPLTLVYGPLNVPRKPSLRQSITGRLSICARPLMTTAGDHGLPNIDWGGAYFVVDMFRANGTKASRLTGH